MKFLSLHLLLCTSLHLRFSYGYGVRGAAERVLYYYAYLAEEVTTTNDFTVAPGCGEAMEGLREIRSFRRCSFNQFLQCIWKEQRPGETRPKVTAFARDLDFANADFNPRAVFEKLLQWKEADTKIKLTGEVDGARLMRGATSYYDALSKMGNPISLAKAALPGLDRTTTEYIRGKAVVDRGAQAADLVIDLRQKDLDRYRIPALNKLLPDGIEVEVKPGRDTWKLAQTYDVLDPVETINRNRAKRPTIEEDLAKAQSVWEAKPANGQHMMALRSAQQAREKCGC